MTLTSVHGISEVLAPMDQKWTAEYSPGRGLSDEFVGYHVKIDYAPGGYRRLPD